MSNTLNMKIAVSTSTGEDTLDDGTPLAVEGPIVEPPVVARTGEPEIPAEARSTEARTVEATAGEPEITDLVFPAETAPADSRPLGGSSEVRQFIAMLRRERTARTRARRLKRLGWAMGAAAAAAFVAARSNNPDPDAATLAPELATVAEAAALPADDPPALDPAAPSVFDLVDSEPAGTVPQVEIADPGQPLSPCEESFAQQRWRAAVEICTKVFEESPGAALALRIAHAHYSRGQTTPAGFWARTALGLGSKDADAFVLIGHSERQAGHTKNAADAYRRYLQSSPRGWHAKRLRAALRELKPRPAAYRPPSVRQRSERTL